MSHPKLNPRRLLPFVFVAGLIAASILVVAKVPAANPKPEIVLNEADQSVGVVIGGREVARFTANGLIVQGSIEYSGTMTDNQGVLE